VAHIQRTNAADEVEKRVAVNIGDGGTVCAGGDDGCGAGQPLDTAF
jgi:hypothetical protein